VSTKPDRRLLQFSVLVASLFCALFVALAENDARWGAAVWFAILTAAGIVELAL
jgi:hypothetical protein